MNSSILDISNKGLEQLPFIEKQHEFVEIEANANRFPNITSFYPFAKVLKRLRLSNNLIASIDGRELFPFLVELDLDQNRLTSFSSKIFPALSRLSLRENQLKDFPDVSHSPSLQSLRLDGNLITSLIEIPTKCPKNLEELSICDNRIENLCEVVYLSSLSSLHSLSIHGNPCLKDSNRFNYRPYIYSILYTGNGCQLKSIDGAGLHINEIISAEDIYISGKKNRLEPGNHDALVTFLTKKCPADYIASPEAKKEARRYARVLEKKKELEETVLINESSLTPTSRTSNSTHDTSYSIHSPYSEWNRKLLSGDKENLPTMKNLATSTNTSRTSTPKITARTPASTYSSQTNSARTNALTSSSRSTGRPLSSSENKPLTPLTSTSPRGRATRTTVLLQKQSQRGPTSRGLPFEQKKGQRNGNEMHIAELKELVLEQDLTVKELQQQIVALTEITDITTGNLNQLEEEHRDLKSTLAHTRELLEARDEKYQAKINALQASLSSCRVPVPEKVNIQSESDGTVSVEWEIRCVKSYNMLVDGVMVGNIKGMKNAAKVTELTPGDHSFQLAAVAWDGTVGIASSPVTLSI